MPDARFCESSVEGPEPEPDLPEVDAGAVDFSATTSEPGPELFAR